MITGARLRNRRSDTTLTRPHPKMIFSLYKIDVHPVPGHISRVCRSHLPVWPRWRYRPAEAISDEHREGNGAALDGR
jgi:hypothetical protein